MVAAGLWICRVGAFGPDHSVEVMFISFTDACVLVLVSMDDQF